MSDSGAPYRMWFYDEAFSNEQKIERLQSLVDDLLAVLEGLEWVIDDLDTSRYYCPWCGNYKEPYGHSPECGRQKAIARAGGES